MASLKHQKAAVPTERKRRLVSELAEFLFMVVPYLMLACWIGLILWVRERTKNEDERNQPDDRH